MLRDGGHCCAFASPDMEFKTPWPAAYSKWAWLSMAGTISSLSVAPAGFCMHVQVQLGQTIAYVASDGPESVASLFDSSLRPISLDLKSEIDVRSLKWKRIILNVGDVLYVLFLFIRLGY